MAAGPARKLEGRLAQIYVTIDATKTKIGHLTDYEIDVTAAEIDASDHDTDGWEDKLTGLKSWKGTAKYLYLTTEATHTALFDAMVSNADLEVEFRPVDAVDEVCYQGTMRLTDWKLAGGNSDVQAENISFSGRGPLTAGTIAAPGGDD